MIYDAVNDGLSDAYSHGQYNTVCSDDDTLQRVYDKQNMLMEGNCCIQHCTRDRKRRFECYSHLHVH